MAELLIAPLSHNRLRDWPQGNYVTLIGTLLQRLPNSFEVVVIGTAKQRPIVNDIVRPYPAYRVFNACGMSWTQVQHRVGGAACVVGNNSGIAHLAAALDVPTVCIFGGSHQRTEWAPIGKNVTVLSREIGCSPCQFNHAEECSYGVACLREISPQVVGDAVVLRLQRAHRLD